jgi:hypothetical protein
MYHPYIVDLLDKASLLNIFRQAQVYLQLYPASPYIYHSYILDLLDKASLLNIFR